jgi:hypothetical protein
MEADVGPLVFFAVELQELAIGIELNGQKIRHVQNRRPLAKILSYALFLGE